MKAVAFALTLVALTGACYAQSLKSQIKAMNKPIRAAMMKKDIDGFAKVVKGGITPDFKYSENGQAMSFDQMLDGMKQGFAMYSKITKADTHLVKVSEKGAMGSAIEKHVMEGTGMGPDKKAHKMAFMGTSIETYKKVKGKWMMASMNMKTDKMTMDGKAMPMQPMGKGK
jgi:hypothetical protein